MEQEVRKYLRIHNDFTMKKIFDDARLYPGVISYLEFEAPSISVVGIREGLFGRKYLETKTLTKIGRRRSSGVGLHIILQSISEK